MEFNQNSDDSESIWSAFEQLEELENVVSGLDDLSIPDSTYRQIKELNRTLIAKAKHLANLEQQLQLQKEELELNQRNFEALKLQCNRESTESRLSRLIRIDQAKADGELSQEELEAEVNRVRAIEKTWQQANDLPVENSAVAEDSDSQPQAMEELKDGQQLSRMQSSAENLREKSEAISAVFVELDHMVRDLNRQQELLNEIKFRHSQQSVEELDRVNDKFKRRFHRFFRKMKPHANQS